MLVRLFTIALSFLVSCFGASVVLVLFVFTPSEIFGLPPDARIDRLAKASELATFVAAQAALFCAPFALVAIVVGELLGNRRLAFYLASGILIAALGFFAQHATEQAGQPTIANAYALSAFLTSGFAGGLIYWLIAGRRERAPGRGHTITDTVASAKTDRNGTPAAS